MGEATCHHFLLLTKGVASSMPPWGIRADTLSFLLLACIRRMLLDANDPSPPWLCDKAQGKDGSAHLLSRCHPEKDAKLNAR
jgi:hypothetical protein